MLQDIVIPRGFYVSTTDIWDSSSWSDPTYFDVPGIDQDVRNQTRQRLFFRTTLANLQSSFLTMTAKFISLR